MESNHSCMWLQEGGQVESWSLKAWAGRSTHSSRPLLFFLLHHLHLYLSNSSPISRFLFAFFSFCPLPSQDLFYFHFYASRVPLPFFFLCVVSLGARPLRSEKTTGPYNASRAYMQSRTIEIAR